MTVEHLRLASDRESLDASEPEDERLCDRCEHALDYHRTPDRRCTAQVPNPAGDCALCGSHLIAAWSGSEPHRCSGCGARTEQFRRCGCDLTPRLVTP